MMPWSGKIHWHDLGWNGKHYFVEKPDGTLTAFIDTYQNAVTEAARIWAPESQSSRG